MAVSGNRKRREIYMPLFEDSEKVNTPYCYRCLYDCEDCAEKHASEVAEALEAGGNEIAGFIFEPVSGATLGAAAPPNGYLQRTAETCRSRGVLVIADEVMTGFGRTGKNFAVEHWSVQPDILIAAKGIASGYAPLGAVIASRTVLEAIDLGSGTLVHGFTYNAHPVSMAAGRAALRKIKESGLVAAASSDGTIGGALKSEMASLRECQSVGDVRGIGLLWGVEFVADRASKQAFAPDKQYSSKVAAEAASRGVMTYPMQGCVDGFAGDHLLLAPPAVSAAEDIHWAIEQLKISIQEVERNSRA
jgi:adenosylmethionine-8-amino-7-oxononanoate aminotransferase